MSASSLKIIPFRAISNTLLQIFVVYLLAKEKRRFNLYKYWLTLHTRKPPLQNIVRRKQHVPVHGVPSTAIIVR